MAMQVGDYVKFKRHAHNGTGKEQEYIGRIEKNPAEGLVNGGFVPINGLIAVIYQTHPHGANERILLKESEMQFVLACPHDPFVEHVSGDGKEVKRVRLAEHNALMAKSN